MIEITAKVRVKTEKAQGVHCKLGGQYILFDFAWFFLENRLQRLISKYALGELS